MDKSKGNAKRQPLATAARKNSNLKFIIPGVAGFVILVAVIALIVALQGDGDLCAEYLRELGTDKEDIDTELSPTEMRSCLLGTCNFDPTECKTPCPFGYNSDDEERGCPTSCECAVEGVTQGDVAFRPESLSKMLADYGEYDKKEDFALFFGWKWDIFDQIEVDGRFKVPYMIEDKFSNNVRQGIESTLKNMSKYMCVDFIPHTEERDYLRYSYFGQGGQSCGARVGRTPGPNMVSLARGCRYRSIIQHETLHELGFHHEHTRPDRDAYVDVIWDQIQAGQDHNFKKKTLDAVKSLNSEYDFSSVMHYESYLWATEVGGSTLLAKDGSKFNYNNMVHLATKEDVREVNILYGCESSAASITEQQQASGLWSMWQEWSSCTETCGTARRKRFRKCIYQASGEEMPDGCGEKNFEMENCDIPECPAVDDQWSEWYQWGICSATCGNGKRQRYRFCVTFETGCKGTYVDFDDCFEASCETGNPITRKFFGNWVNWDSWRRCDVTCGEGNRVRYRECLREGGYAFVSASNCKSLPIDGIIVGDKQQQTSSCKAHTSCSDMVTLPPTGDPFDTSTTTVMTTQTPRTPDPFRTEAPTGPGYYEWMTWFAWSRCDVTCGRGKRKRKRECSGSYCAGKCTEEESCDVGDCPGSHHIFGVDTVTVASMCVYGKMLIGRFDPDDADDIICVYPDGCVRVYCSDMSSNSYIPEAISWEGKAEVCSFVGSVAGDDTGIKIWATDVNGDGKSDLVCYNRNTDEFELTLNGEKGFSQKVDWRGKRAECLKRTTDVYAFADVTGDGKADFICGKFVIQSMYESTCG